MKFALNPFYINHFDSMEKYQMIKIRHLYIYIFELPSAQYKKIKKKCFKFSPSFLLKIRILVVLKLTVNPCEAQKWIVYSDSFAILSLMKKVRLCHRYTGDN